MKNITNHQKFPEDFEMEAKKDFIYLLEEETLAIKEILEEEHRLPAKIEIIGTLPPKKREKHEVERNNTSLRGVN